MDTLTELDPSVTARLDRAHVGYPELNSIEFRRLHNALRILRSMEADELGIALDARQARHFANDPGGLLICGDDRTKAAIWRAIQERQPADLRAEAHA